MDECLVELTRAGRVGRRHIAGEAVAALVRGAVRAGLGGRARTVEVVVCDRIAGLVANAGGGHATDIEEARVEAARIASPARWCATILITDLAALAGDADVALGAVVVAHRAVRTVGARGV